MPKGKINKRFVDRLPIENHRYIAWDIELRGFGVRVSTEGRKSYIVQYRLNGRAGRSQTVTLGAHGNLTADQARKLASQTLGKVAGKIDVAAEKRKAKQAQQAAHSVSEISRLFMSMHAHAKLEARTAAEYQRLFNRVINPAIGRKLVKDLTFGDVEKLHHDLRETPGSANRSVALLSKLMTWSIRGGYRPDRQNPCQGLEKFPERKLQRFLSEVELGQLGSAIRIAESEGLPWDIDPAAALSKHLSKAAAAQRTVISPWAAAALRLLIFTGARLNEILKLRWEHVDITERTLTIPDHKTRRITGAPKTIMLNAPSLEILANLPRLAGNPFVIAGDRPGAHRTDLKRPWAAVRRLANLQGVRIHDLRHTLASHGRAAGVSLSVVGGLLGHRNVSTTAGYAHLWNAPKQEASEKIGSRLAAALDGSPAPTADTLPTPAARKVSTV